MCHISRSVQPNSYERETRSVRLKGYVTSVGLEEEFWAILERLAEGENVPIGGLLAEFYDEYTRAGSASSFTSFLRVSCVEIVRHGRMTG